MILDSLLSSSPVLLFVASGLLLLCYGAVRFVQACQRVGRRWFAGSTGRNGFPSH